MPRKLGLIGYPLSHSFSEKYFSAKFEQLKIHTDYSYHNYEIASVSALKSIIDKEAFLVGLNVTIPHKQAVLDLLDEVHPDAKAIGAVNTIFVDRAKGNKLYGYNTDHLGFKGSLLQLIGSKRPAALILGTGGAAKAIQFVLRNLGIDFRMVSRRKSQNTLTYQEVDQKLIEDFPLVINTTPLGTYPAIEDKPNLPYHLMTSQNYLYDLVYNPVQTAFLAQGEAQGAQTKNGLDMLHIQADEAWEIWMKSLSPVAGL